MKPNQIIMALSLLGLSCSYALADNYSESTEARINSANAGLDWLANENNDPFDSGLTHFTITPDNVQDISEKLESNAYTNISEGINIWSQPKLDQLTLGLSQKRVQQIWFNPNTANQLYRYGQMMETLTSGNLNPIFGLNLNQYDSINGKVFSDFLVKATAKKPLIIRINQKSAKPFFDGLAEVFSSSLSHGKPIVINGLPPKYAGELTAVVEKNPFLKGKLTINLADFKKFGDKPGSKLIYDGVGITGQGGMITVNPIDRNHFKVQSYGLDGTEIKPVVWTKSEVDDNIIKKVFKSPVLKKD